MRTPAPVSPGGSRTLALPQFPPLLGPRARKDASSDLVISSAVVTLAAVTGAGTGRLVPARLSAAHFLFPSPRTLPGSLRPSYGQTGQPQPGPGEERGSAGRRSVGRSGGWAPGARCQPGVCVGASPGGLTLPGLCPQGAVSQPH